MKDYAKEIQIDQRLARLEQELARLYGSHDMMHAVALSLIETHPEKDRLREALSPMLRDLKFHSPAQKQGLDDALKAVRQALGPRPDGQTS